MDDAGPNFGSAHRVGTAKVEVSEPANGIKDLQKFNQSWARETSEVKAICCSPSCDALADIPDHSALHMDALRTDEVQIALGNARFVSQSAPGRV